MGLSRRMMVGATTAGAASLALGQDRMSQVKIEKIDLFPMRYPMKRYFKFFTGPHEGNGRASIIIKITGSNGTIGWGQSVPIAKWSYETLETATITLRDYFAPALIGHNPTDIAGAHERMDKAIAPGFSTGMPITRAGIDIALHDLTGKLRNQSLAQMWEKPSGKRIKLSWTVNVKTLDDVETVMNEGSKLGYKNFNIKVGPDPAFDVQLAKRVRANAPDCFLWADANGGYTPQKALIAAPKLADAGVDILEAPLRPNQISGYQALKKQGALPILMDEGVIDPQDLEEFIKLDMLDGIASKPSRCGGLSSNKRQIELCLEHGLMWVGSGLTDPDISLAATLGLYGAYELKTPAALNGHQFLNGDVLKRPIKIADGYAYLPNGPGLGIQVDEQKVIELMKQSGGDRLLRGLR